MMYTRDKVLYEVPLSHGLFISEGYKGSMGFYSKKTETGTSDTNVDCFRAAEHMLKQLEHPDYYLDEDLVFLTYKKAKDNCYNMGRCSSKNDTCRCSECGYCDFECELPVCCDCEYCTKFNPTCGCVNGGECLYKSNCAADIEFQGFPLDDFERHFESHHISEFKLNSKWWTLDDVLTVKEPITLKEFDPLQSHYGLFLLCKIKNIGTPKMNSKFKRYEQKIILYDDYSKKQIKSLIIGDDVFFGDEFEKGDYVLVIGDYFKSHSIPYKIHKIKHLESTGDVSEEWRLKYHAYICWDHTEVLQKKSQDKSNNSSVSRNSSSYNAWKDAVLTRDKVCQCCGGDKYPEVHHIFGYKDNESLRENPENGIVLCKWCHKKYHSYYGKKANPLDLVDFLNRFGTKQG